MSTQQAKHTPGPWRVRLCAGWYAAFEVQPTASRARARAMGKDESGAGSADEVEAVRLLVEAAPDLLDALREAMSAVKVFHGPDCWDIYEANAPEWRRWSAVIAKATGSAS